MMDNQSVRLFDSVQNEPFKSRYTLDFTNDREALVTLSSGGAAYTNVDFYKIADNGYQVQWLEGLSTYNPNASDDYTPHYHRPDGTYEMITVADYDRILEKYLAKDYRSNYHAELN